MWKFWPPGRRLRVLVSIWFNAECTLPYSLLSSTFLSHSGNTNQPHSHCLLQQVAWLVPQGSPCTHSSLLCTPFCHTKQEFPHAKLCLQASGFFSIGTLSMVCFLTSLTEHLCSNVTSSKRNHSWAVPLVSKRTPSSYQTVPERKEKNIFRTSHKILVLPQLGCLVKGRSAFVTNRGMLGFSPRSLMGMERAQHWLKTVLMGQETGECADPGSGFI